MNMPGYTAEAALDKTLHPYRMVTPATVKTGAVHPQLLPRCLCWSTRSGGLACICEGDIIVS
jgi:hypothetical protein